MMTTTIPTDNVKFTRPPHISLVQKQTRYDESDYHSEDEPTRPRQLSSPRADVSTQNAVRFTFKSNDDDLDTTCTSSLFVRNHHSQIPLSAASPALCRRNNIQCHVPIGQRRSRSVSNLAPLTQKITNDSGTGDSLLTIAPAAAIQPVRYDTVPVYGQLTPVFVANRYDFNPKVLDMHRKQKASPKLPVKKSKQLTVNQFPSVSSLNSSTSRTSDTVFGRFIKIFKPQPSSNSPVPATTITRHH